MMSEKHSENGRINDVGEEEVEFQLPSSLKQSLTTPLSATPPDPMNATPPVPASTTPPVPMSATPPVPANAMSPDRASQEEPVMEFFGQKGESGSEGDSPREQDNVSHHSRSYVTVSPSVSPGEWRARYAMERE